MDEVASDKPTSEDPRSDRSLGNASGQLMRNLSAEQIDGMTNGNGNGNSDSSDMVRSQMSPAETNPSENDPHENSPTREFIQQFVKAQRRLYLYLLAQTADPNLAEEVLQNANVVILSKWKQFEPGTNFLAWVYRIASLELLKYRQNRRRGRLMFDDEFIQSVAETVEELDEMNEPRRRALASCLQKLRPRDREMIQLRYQLGNNGQKLSEKLNRPINSIYQSLGRIRRTLFECIQREMAALTR